MHGANEPSESYIVVQRLQAAPCFACGGHVNEGEQNSGDDSPGRSLHHNMYDRFPPADSERERRLAIPIRHKQDDFFCGAQDQRNHDQAQRETTGIT